MGSVIEKFNEDSVRAPEDTPMTFLPSILLTKNEKNIIFIHNEYFMEVVGRTKHLNYYLGSAMSFANR